MRYPVLERSNQAAPIPLFRHLEQTSFKLLCHHQHHGRHLCQYTRLSTSFGNHFQHLSQHFFFVILQLSLFCIVSGLNFGTLPHQVSNNFPFRFVSSTHFASFHPFTLPFFTSTFSFYLASTLVISSSIAGLRVNSLFSIFRHKTSHLSSATVGVPTSQADRSAQQATNRPSFHIGGQHLRIEVYGKANKC